MAITSLKFFGPQDARKEISDEKKADDESQDIDHGQSLSHSRI
jgi:hypothetical protein